jgi:hypothetical protein
MLGPRSVVFHESQPDVASAAEHDDIEVLGAIGHVTDASSPVRAVTAPKVPPGPVPAGSIAARRGEALVANG